MSKPINVSTYTFSDLIKGSFVYVDKTRYLYDLVRLPKGYYFISRPRRFGKSLMVSTLAELFKGNRALFQNLWIGNSDYDWQSYPVVRIDFSLDSVHTVAETELAIDTFLRKIAETNEIELDGANYKARFRHLVEQLAEKYNKKVVLLIDEYDKPITDNLSNIDEARRIRNALRGFYGVVKGMDAYWHFVMITGISKFSKVGIFSMMNNLEDITMDPKYASMLGLTDAELQQNFQAHIDAFAAKDGMSSEEMLAKIRRWYDGFRFSSSSERVYNPLSTMTALKQQRFANFWFSTGTPTFLINLLQENQYNIQAIEEITLDELAFSTYEITDLGIETLLFQTGYLTISDYTHEGDFEIFHLAYPNLEVKNAFVTFLLNAYSGTVNKLTAGHLHRLIRALETQNVDQFFELLNVFFAQIHYELHLKYEKFYQAIFYMIFVLLGVRVDAEVKTNDGRIDAVIELDDHIYIFEFKLDKDADTALQQSIDKAYAQKYQLHGKPITLVGVNFDTSKRKLTDWKHVPKA
ncbi:MAG: AAA family ATPase [Chloroflexota bacterium]